MPHGAKFGGRVAGTLNRKTQALKDLIEENYEGFDPILELIEISKKEKVPVDIKVSILKDIAQYIYPRRKAIEQDITADIKPQKTIEEVLLEIERKTALKNE